MDPKTLLRPLVRKVVVDSAVLPDIVADDPFAPDVVAPSVVAGGDSFVDVVLKFARPRFTLYSDVGQPITIQPWGPPPAETYWPWLKLGGLAVGGLAAFGLFAAVRGLIRRK